jgi:hypothetical protein
LRFCVFCLFLLPSLSVAQQALFNATYPERLEPLFERYNASIGEGAAIYNGPEYEGNDLTIAGNPFFLSKNFVYGSVIYMGFRYDSIVMAYDCFRDELILAYPMVNEFFAIVPVKSRIDAFQIHAHEFVQIRDENKYPGIEETGFFDVVYNGEHRILARREKRAASYVTGNYLQRFEPDDYYYIRKDGIYHKVQGRRGLLNLFKDHKRELRRFIRQSNYDFKDGTDALLREAGAYLDELR